MERPGDFVGTLTVHVIEARLPTPQREYIGHEKFYPYYSLSLIDEQGDAKEPPGVFDSKTSKDRSGIAHFVSPAWEVKFPVPGATRLRIELYSKHIVTADKCLQFFDFSLQKLLKGSHVRHEQVYTIGGGVNQWGRARDDNYLPEVLFIQDRRESYIKVRVTWEGSQLISEAISSIHNKEVLPLSRVKELFASFSSHTKGLAHHFTDAEELWTFLDQNNLLGPLSSFDMFLAEGSLFNQVQEVLMQDLPSGGSGRPPRASMLFNLCDLNHDEKVDFKEVIMLLAACSDATGAERTELAFSLLDTDHSGNLSLREVTIIQQWSFMHLFHAVLQYILLKASAAPQNLEDQVEGWWKELLLQKQYPNHAGQIIMDLADKDQSGTISRAEYTAFMRDPGAQEVLVATYRSYLVEIKQVFDAHLEPLQKQDDQT
eukprot:TRINITY_DN5077_c0_g1_i1.p1 TRINITY_DN5077_c0_g1~~TRINITY_DN5077_c0_g1_i1.p1  ORF type:complete len:452 (-),score=51.66 TRINITY_DN5077_c0_g1_i1:7-1293(-)